MEVLGLSLLSPLSLVQISRGGISATCFPWAPTAHAIISNDLFFFFWWYWQMWPVEDRTALRGWSLALVTRGHCFRGCPGGCCLSRTLHPAVSVTSNCRLGKVPQTCVAQLGFIIANPTHIREVWPCRHIKRCVRPTPHPCGTQSKCVSPARARMCIHRPWTYTRGL